MLRYLVSVFLHFVAPVAGVLTASGHVWPAHFPTKAAELGFTSRFVEVAKDLQVHVVDRPGFDDSLNPALFIHGWPDSWRSWQRLLPLLGSGRRLLAIDLRGFGQSDKPLDATYDMTMFADDVKVVLDKLGIFRLGVLVGHSMGSLIAWHFAGRWPDLQENLVLVGTGPTGDFPAVNDILEQLAGLNDLSYDFIEAFQNSTFYDVRKTGRWFQQTVVHESSIVPLAVWKAALRNGIYATTEQDANKLVTNITCPTLLVRGDADELFTLEHQEKMLSLLHTGRLVEVEHAGHSVQWEEGGARVLAKLLTELDFRRSIEELAAATGPVASGEADSIPLWFVLTVVVAFVSLALRLRHATKFSSGLSYQFIDS